jgi:hypothetical protein
MIRLVKFLIAVYAINRIFWYVLWWNTGRKWSITQMQLADALWKYNLHYKAGWYRWSKEEFDRWDPSVKRQPTT